MTTDPTAPFTVIIGGNIVSRGVTFRRGRVDLMIGHVGQTGEDIPEISVRISAPARRRGTFIFSGGPINWTASDFFRTAPNVSKKLSYL